MLYQRCKGCGEVMMGVYSYSIRSAHDWCGGKIVEDSKQILQDRIKARRKNVPLTKSGNDVA